MARHRIHLDEPDAELSPGGQALIVGEEAKHAARVKRLGVGDELDLLDGRGGLAHARLEQVDRDPRSGDWRLRLRVERLEREAPLAPALHVRSAAPKGPRLEDMVDALSQAGAASWGLLRTERGVVEPRDAKTQRLRRVARESAKQCARAWDLVIDEPSDLPDALARPGVVLADASGACYARTGLGELTLLVGPEGGWTPDELARARSAGARVVGFGPHVMRIETAAVVAAAIVLDAERRPS